MGEELSMARPESRPYHRRKDLLLADSGTGRTKPKNLRRKARKEKDSAVKGKEVKTPRIVKKAGKSSDEAEVSNVSRTKPTGHRRNDKTGKSTRESQVGYSSVRRSAQELGIDWFDHQCLESPSDAHCMVKSDIVGRGGLFRCQHCQRHKWLPFAFEDVQNMKKLVEKYGYSIAYCKTLDKYPSVRMLMIKLQDLWDLKRSGMAEVEFEQVVVAVMADRNYDK